MVAAGLAGADTLAGFAAATVACGALGVAAHSKVAASSPKMFMPDYAGRSALMGIRYKSERPQRLTLQAAPYFTPQLKFAASSVLPDPL